MVEVPALNVMAVALCKLKAFELFCVQVIVDDPRLTVLTPDDPEELKVTVVRL
jgi:hypothetical protein